MPPFSPLSVIRNLCTPNREPDVGRGTGLGRRRRSPQQVRFPRDSNNRREKRNVGHASRNK